MSNEKTEAITHEEFVQAVGELLSEMDWEEILQIPGVWDAAAEYLNNDAIDRVYKNRA